MNKYRALVLILLTLPFASALAAQEKAASPSGEAWSSYYYVNVPIVRVYSHRLGYVVTYQKSGYEVGRTYLPLAWFEKAGSKGDLIMLKSGKQWPYMTIFYKDGAFSHIRLHVRREVTHESWGNLPQGTDIDDKFDVEELKLEL